MNYSNTEKALLRELQRDCSQSLAQIADRCGMAQSTVWRKVQEFDASGAILRRVALLSPSHAGCKLTVLATIILRDHAEATVSGFAALIAGHPEVVECLATSGTADYQMKVRVADVEAYEHFMTNTLLRSPYVREVHSSFVLKELKSTTELPL
ncbi:Lrp/AsnC family transcriptional regulator [Pseudosulfitobacter sp. DSM 107133]|jgi:Lrp/AsnC family transcriptional regulator|uniref:Lrp/AsnC family transcriptional regulator n=1 Tax=Pseudosulfitobacter sp. DSM 107133 TaxID=2883100 RepID=UPI000DF29FA2|nr:Lrp/AsnC family transcriptional regulator [Pseudosulfitobacter sp. DSM 107133]UOA25597.1 DNA-binding transcriptional activator DecR [Pseudosulfitobacter sp. DSM 107133]